MDVELGLLLIGGGLVLYIIEMFNPGFFIAVPGTVLMVVGILLLFFPDLFLHPLSWLGLIVLAGASTWVTMRGYRRWAPPSKSTTTPSVDNIVGRLGVVLGHVGPDGGEVRIEGELWRARSETALPAGARIQVVGLDGNLTVLVQPAERAQPPKE